MANAQDRQRQIYIAGLSGQKPRIPTDYLRLRDLARRCMDAGAFAYVDGGAGAEETIANNRTGFHAHRIQPRMLKGLSGVDPSVSLFGRTISSPFLLAPIGVLELAHPSADRAVAKAAASLGVPMIFSNQASVAMEDCAALMADSPRYFQLYWSKNNDLVASLVQRAESCGCEAIVITLDTTLLGWRPRDLDLAFLPFLKGQGIAQYTSDPVFRLMVDQPEQKGNGPSTATRVTPTTLMNLFQLMNRYPGGFFQNLLSGRALRGVRTFIQTYSRPSLSWEDLSFVRQLTGLPILLKGILHPDDAKRAMEEGMDGLIVSNHGGRQVDGAISSIEALPEIVRAVGPDFPVLLDSGIRGGADAFKALALGAHAVCIGRPYVFALAIAGERGVAELIANYQADFELTMALAGCRDISAIDANSLMRP